MGNVHKAAAFLHTSCAYWGTRAFGDGLFMQSAPEQTPVGVCLATHAPLRFNPRQKKPKPCTNGLLSGRWFAEGVTRREEAEAGT